MNLKLSQYLTRRHDSGVIHDYSIHLKWEDIEDVYIEIEFLEDKNFKNHKIIYENQKPTDILKEENIGNPAMTKLSSGVIKTKSLDFLAYSKEFDPTTSETYFSKKYTIKIYSAINNELIQTFEVEKYLNIGGPGNQGDIMKPKP
jgi:hypothetical protein